MVMVENETDLVDIKVPCPIDIGYGNRHKLEFPIHRGNLSRGCHMDAGAGTHR